MGEVWAGVEGPRERTLPEGGQTLGLKGRRPLEIQIEDTAAGPISTEFSPLLIFTI